LAHLVLRVPTTSVAVRVKRSRAVVTGRHAGSTLAARWRTGEVLKEVFAGFAEERAASALEDPVFARASPEAERKFRASGVTTGLAFWVCGCGAKGRFGFDSIGPNTSRFSSLPPTGTVQVLVGTTVRRGRTRFTLILVDVGTVASAPAGSNPVHPVGAVKVGARLARKVVRAVGRTSSDTVLASDTVLRAWRAYSVTATGGAQLLDVRPFSADRALGAHNI
jgi:hypothetical protein